MTPHNSQLSTLHSQLITAMLLLTFSCNYSGKNPDMKTIEPPAVIDSLFVPTGNAELDSLFRLAAVAKQDTNLVKLYVETGDLYKNNDFEKAKDYYLKAGKLSDYLDWNEGRYVFAVSFANILNRESLPDSAIIISMQALEFARRENNEGWIGRIAIIIGDAYFNKDWNETALTFYTEALSIFEKRNETKYLITLYYMLCQVYRDMGTVEKAIEYGEKAIALNPESSSALCCLGLAYSHDSRNYEKSNHYLEEALRICKQQNNTYLIGMIYYNLGNNALMVFDLDKAESYTQKSLEIHQKMGNTGGYCEALITLSKLEQLKGRLDKSEKYVKEALQIAQEYEMLQNKRYCYMILSEITMAQRNYRDYMKYWQENDLVEMAIASKSSLLAAEEMAAKYESEKKELEIENQKQIIKSQNLQRGLLAGGIAISVILLILSWYMLRLRARRNHALTERNDLLAEMNATKDKFFNIISHDMKNPAEAQRDAMKMLVENASKWDSETLALFYNGLLETAESNVELIYNLLGWAQLQTGRLVFRPVTFNIAVTLRSDIALIRNIANKKGINFKVDISDDADVTGDCNMIATVVRNLLSNAVKFTQKDGEVSLSISSTEGIRDYSTISPSTKVSGFEFRLSDSGIGMTPSQLSNLFRLDKPNSRPGTAGERGSGLGLIVCRDLLEKHGATLNVESEEGRGSRFWFVV